MIPDHPPARGSLRSAKGRGRPYPAEAVAAVRAMVEGTDLLFRDIAERTGIGPVAIARWSRRHGWRRPEGAVDIDLRLSSAVSPSPPPPPFGRSPSPAGGGGSEAAPVGDPHPRGGGRGPCGPAKPAAWWRGCAPPVAFPAATEAGCPTPETPQREDRPGPRRVGRYGPADHEAARALIEGTRLSLERIELRLGISSLTLFRWRKRFSWRRPAPLRVGGPQFPRYRRRRGRPYAADAVGLAETLATTTHLSQARIAAQAGICQQTVSAWIRQRGWTRPSVRRGQPGYPAACRAAALAAAASAGRRRGRGYGPDVLAEARRLYRATELPTSLIAARVRVSASTVARWARNGGWTRPRDMPEPDGRPARRLRSRGPRHPLLPSLQ